MQGCSYHAIFLFPLLYSTFPCSHIRWYPCRLFPRPLLQATELGWDMRPFATSNACMCPGDYCQLWVGHLRCSLFHSALWDPPWNLRKGMEHPQCTWRILPLARLPLPMHMCPCSWMVEATTITEWAAFCYLQCTDTHCMHLGRDRAPPICGIKHWNWEFKRANKKQRYLFWLNQPYLFVHEIFEAAKSSWAWISARKGMAVNNKLKGMAEIDKLNYTWPAMVFHFQTPSDKLLYWLFAIIKKSECNIHY